MDGGGDDVLLDTTLMAPSVSESKSAQTPNTKMQIDEEGRPSFPPSGALGKMHIAQTRKVLVPPHRMTPLKSTWLKIYPPLVSHLKLQVRMNMKGKAVELRTSKYTCDDGALQKGEDFIVRAP